MKQQNVLQNIQALRGLAAMMVVFFHSRAIGPGLYWPGADGSNGVDLFFVISGFIMVHTTKERSTSPATFMLNRFRRIVPFYWLITFAVFCLALIAPTIFQSTDANLRELFLSLLFIPYEKDSGAMQPLVFVGWTLNYEMFFYCLFAASLFLRNLKVRIAIVAATLVALITIGPLVAPEGALSFYTRPIVLHFALGMMLAFLTPVFSRSIRASYALLIASLGTILAMPSYIAGTFGYALAAFVLVGSALALESRGKKSTSRVVQKIGDASYAIYLTHFFITGLALKISTHVTSLTGQLALTIFAIVASALAGYVAHRAVEVPLNTWTGNLLNIRRAKDHKPKCLSQQPYS